MEGIRLSRSRRTLARLLAVFLAAGLSLAATAKRTSDAEMRPFDRCLEVRSEPASGSAILRVEARLRGAEITHSRARLSWHDSDEELRVLLQMLAPAELAGSSLLLIEARGERPEAFAYLPEIEKVKRVGSRHLRKPLFGTTLSYADFEWARGLVEAEEIESWREDDLSGRRAWQLEIRSGSEQIVMWLDQELCVPLRTDLTDRKGRLARQIRVSSQAADASASAFIPRSLLVRDLLEERETRVDVETVELGAALPAALFDPASLANSEDATRLQ